MLQLTQWRVLCRPSLEDICDSITSPSSDWRVGILRLFEVVGAHSNERLGPAVTRPAMNWLVELCHAARGKLPYACIPGHNLPTPDGTPIRDFVHVEDVATGFIKALDTLELYGESFTVNIGTGIATSLIESLHLFEQVCGRAVKTRLTDQAPMASHCSVADITLARELLGWQPQYTYADMCRHTWGWYDAYIHKRLSA